MCVLFIFFEFILSHASRNFSNSPLEKQKVSPKCFRFYRQIRQDSAKSYKIQQFQLCSGAFFNALDHQFLASVKEGKKTCKKKHSENYHQKHTFARIFFCCQELFCNFSGWVCVRILKNNIFVALWGSYVNWSPILEVETAWIIANSSVNLLKFFIVFTSLPH